MNENILTLNFTLNHLKKSLACVSSQKVPKDALPNAFDEIAHALLRHTKIVTPANQYYLREIEFYFYDKERHLDPYAHKNKRQLKFGEWYFYRYTDIEPFLNSHRNGVDITFGNEERDVYGGILIRKIQNLRTGKLIAGINKVARELIENVEQLNVNAIVLGCGEFVFNASQTLHLASEINNSSMPIFKTQRHGLTFKDVVNAKYFYKALTVTTTTI